MANLSEDIQCAGSDTRPPMLDKTDFASWQQRIRLYCRGKENGVNILKSIDEGPFQMGTTRVIVAEGTEGSLHLGPERPRVYSDLSQDEKDRYNADIRATNIILQGLPKDIYSLINHYTDAKDIWDNVKMLLEGSELTKEDVIHNCAAGYGGGAQNIVGNANPGQARQVKCYNCNRVGHIARNCTQPKRPQNSEYFKDKMLLMQAQKNGVVLDEEQLLFLAGGQDNAIDEDVDEQPVQDLALNMDNVFQADDCDAYNSDIDKAPTAQTMFMANLSSADPVAICEHLLEARDAGRCTKPSYIVGSHAVFTRDSNMKTPIDHVALATRTPYVYIMKQVQPALYSGHVIVTPNHALAVVRDGEETLELVEISRKKIDEKMKANECVDNKMKAEALKEQNTRPIKALTVYPPNTPATLVPRVLPTKSQVKINIFTLRQLFSEFEKTCKKRITPTGITEGERGFEQTKTCYLTEVIPFFKTLQEHFEGIQKALTKEVKEMSDAFDELEAELDQSIVDRKHDEIERKNLLIEHDNIIADGLSKEVFYVASNSELNAVKCCQILLSGT
ncbi:integrase, catalytic region, zinc finger, CCHC-type containing protein [Tanacetum coccineum]